MVTQFPIRLSIIGLGKIAKFQLQALGQACQFQLVAACDLNPMRQVILKENHLLDLPFFTNFQEMIKRIDCDAVLISTPLFNHYETAKIVLQEGRNILLEKPATSSLEALQELIQIAKFKDVIFVVAFHAAFGQEIKWFKEHQSSLFPSQFLINFQSFFADPYLEQGKLLEVVNSLGSSWLDSGINALSIVYPWVENLTLEQVQLQSLNPEFDRTIQAQVNYRFSPLENPLFSGQGTIKTHWNLGLNRKLTRLKFSQSPQEIILDHTEQQVWLITPGQKIERLADFSQTGDRLTQHYIGVFNNFYHHLQNHTHNLEIAWSLHQHLYTVEKHAH